MLSAACDQIWNVSFTKGYYEKIIGYCYHSVIVITFSRAKSDLIKRYLHFTF